MMGEIDRSGNMRKLAIVTMLAVLTATLGLTAVGAGAAVSRGGNEDFCEALATVGDDFTDSSDSSGIDEDSADEIADGLRDAAREAPRKVKKAMKRLARVYDRITDEESVGSLFATRRFLRDSVTYSTYYIEQCLGDLTIPTLDE